MASTIGMVGKAVKPDEAVRNGLKRSRFALHFNTRRLRHWILVRLVNVPVQADSGEQPTVTARLVEPRGPQTSIERLVDNYASTLFVRRWA